MTEKIDYDLPQELKQHILSVLHGSSEKAIKTTSPVLPIGFPLLIYVYAEIPTLLVDEKTVKPEHRLNVAGQVYKTDGQMSIDGIFGQVGFILHPASTYYLFHKPGSYFLNRWCPFLEASPQNLNFAIENLSECKTPLQNIDILISIFQELAKNRLPAIEWLDSSITEINNRNGMVSLAELSEKSGISTGYFRKKFKEIVGISPKYFCKVIQLNSIFDIIKTNQTEKLHRMALDCGYFDQAHFINDFKRFIGISPEKFLKGKHAFVKSYLGRVSI